MGEKLYTISHDSTLRVWNISGISYDAALVSENAKSGTTMTASRIYKNIGTDQLNFTRQLAFVSNTDNGNARIFVNDD